MSPTEISSQSSGAEDPLGLVLQVQRMSTEDGPGLRSTAFLKGCPLSCTWCHNPESLRRYSELQWQGSRCIAGSVRGDCGECVAACPVGALSRVPARGGGPLELRIDREACARASVGSEECGFPCVRACPGGAVERLGEETRASALVRELLKDRAYFESSRLGGITLSGGEASAQRAFSLAVLKAAKAAGVHTALDTCGFAPWEALAELYEYVDLVLWDLKELDSERHLRFTGVSVEPIVENLRRTAALMAAGAGPRAMWVRTPIVPGATDREEGIEAIGRLLARIDTPRLERWELCAFNDLCADKYRRLGLEWAHAGTALMRKTDMESLAAAAGRSLGRPGVVSWTGSVRSER